MIPPEPGLQFESRSFPAVRDEQPRKDCAPGGARAQASRYVLYAAVLVMPAILLFSSVRTFYEIDAQREVYLRELAAAVAARLETIDSTHEPLDRVIASISEEQSYLRDLKVINPGDSSPALAALWAGRELFRTEFVNSGAARIYRAYVPFHSAGVMNIAQIDLDPAAADFLTVHARHNVLFSMAGGVALIAISIYAIWTARRSAALELKQVQMAHLARLGTMSAVLAHEIRNPLGTIKGFAQLALERARSDSTPLLTPILGQTLRLENLVNDLLAYGRPPSPSFRTVHWPDLAQRIDAHAGTLAGDRPLRTNVERPEIELETDAALVEQIVLNLLRNAIDAVGENGKITVAARRTGRSVEISVRDNGPGIPVSDRAKIGEPFFTTKASGTGLGLPISLRLAEALGGTLDIQNAEPAGVVATLRLPGK